MKDIVPSVQVTGATGFVGCSLVKELCRRQTPLLLPRELEISKGRVGDVSTVIHLAARVHVMHDTAAEPLAAFREVNVDATVNLAEQAAAAGVRRFVYLSSIKVNGEATPSNRPFTEHDLPAPQDPYAISKWEAEQGLRKISDHTGMELVIIRPPLVYGLGVKANFSVLMRAVQRGFPLPLGSVRNMRSLVALDNLVDFIVVCATHPGAANQTFLVSDGQDMSTPDLIRAMARAAGVPARLVPFPIRALKTLARFIDREAALERLRGNLQVDITKAREVLGWTPPVDVDEALRRCFVRSPS